MWLKTRKCWLKWLVKCLKVGVTCRRQLKQSSLKVNVRSQFQRRRVVSGECCDGHLECYAFVLLLVWVFSVVPSFFFILWPMIALLRERERCGIGVWWWSYMCFSFLFSFFFANEQAKKEDRTRMKWRVIYVFKLFFSDAKNIQFLFSFFISWVDSYFFKFFRIP